MRGIVYDKVTRRAALADLPCPDPGLPEEVLFHPTLAAICGSDLHMFLGSDGYAWVRSPLILGHEAVGTIQDEKGLFLLNPYIPCGRCKMCGMGNTSLCMGPDGGREKESPPFSLQYGFRRHGGMAEEVAVLRRNLIPVPSGVSPRLAALAESVAVSYHGVNAGANLLHGSSPETAVVLGPGPIGLGAVLVLSARGVKTAVLGLPKDADRLRRAVLLGAGAAVDGTEPLERDVDAWTEGEGVDLVIEATGTAAAWGAAVRVVRRGGVIVSLGIPHEILPLKMREIVRGGVVVVGSYGVTPADLSGVLDLLAGQGERGAALFDRTFPLERGEDAFSYATRSSAKVLLSIGRGAEA